MLAILVMMSLVILDSRVPAWLRLGIPGLGLGALLLGLLWPYVFGPLGTQPGALVSIGEGASVGARTIVYPNAVIGPGAQLGDDCVVHSHVSVRERVRIGSRVVLQDGAVIGSDGFGFVKRPDGTHMKIPQHADVVIEDVPVPSKSKNCASRPSIENRSSRSSRVPVPLTRPVIRVGYNRTRPARASSRESWPAVDSRSLPARQPCCARAWIR